MSLLNYATPPVYNANPRMVEIRQEEEGEEPTPDRTKTVPLFGSYSHCDSWKMLIEWGDSARIACSSSSYSAPFSSSPPDTDRVLINMTLKENEGILREEGRKIRFLS